MAELLLDLKHISKSYGDLEILSDVDLQVAPAQTLSVMGPSGAGKSTLLHIAGLMDKPTSGTVFIHGQDTGKMSDEKRAQQRLNSIGFLFQFHYLLPDYNVLDNILIPARLAGDDLLQKRKQAEELIEKMNLTARIHNLPSQLSGGEQQRVALARALIRNPDILLCDEPTGNLDQKTAADMTDLIFSFVRSKNMSAIIVTHNLDLARRTDDLMEMTDKKLRSNKREVGV